MNEAYGNWLGEYRWDCWATLTFGMYNPSPVSALRSFDRWLSNSALWLSYCDVFYFVATEEGRTNSRNHLHALIGSCSGKTANRNGLWFEWFRRHGRARILPYAKDRGASFYIAKYVSKEFGEWEVGGQWPKRVSA